MDANLVAKMRERADQDGLPIDHPVRIKATALQKVLDAKELSAPNVLGAWARARRAWCDYTGESLI